MRGWMLGAAMWGMMAVLLLGSPTFAWPSAFSVFVSRTGTGAEAVVYALPGAAPSLEIAMLAVSLSASQRAAQAEVWLGTSGPVEWLAGAAAWGETLSGWRIAPGVGVGLDVTAAPRTRFRVAWLPAGWSLRAGLEVGNDDLFWLFGYRQTPTLNGWYLGIGTRQ